MTTEKLYIAQLAVIVKLSNGDCHQIALTKEQADYLTCVLPSVVKQEILPVLPEVLSCDLEPYKTATL